MFCLFICVETQRKGTQREYQLRDFENLYAFSSTGSCALSGCVACCYKLLVQAPKMLDGEVLKPRCHPNVRPEMCPRLMQGGLNSDAKPGFYNSKHRILVVGDGDFTFSLALAKHLGDEANLVATSYQIISELQSIYDKIDITLENLNHFERVTVQHGVDATKLSKTLAPDALAKPFDFVIFNFPCIPDEEGKDGQSSVLEENKRLVRDFLSSAAGLLSPDGQIHVVHKTREPFSWWKIQSLAENIETLEYTRDVVFDRSMYPTYIPRKVGKQESFAMFDAVVHCFRIKMPTAEVKEPLLLDGTSDEDETLLTPSLLEEFSLVKLTSKRLHQIISFLQLATVNPVKFNAKTGKRSFNDFANRGPKKDTKKLRKKQKLQKKSR